jgi:hypothetical protein
MSIRIPKSAAVNVAKTEKTKLPDPALSDAAVQTARKGKAARAQFDGIPTDTRNKAVTSRTTVQSKGVESLPQTGPADTAKLVADLAADLPVDCATARKYSLGAMQEFLALSVPFLVK